MDIITLVKRIYPSKIFFTQPLINYLYSPDTVSKAPLSAPYHFLLITARDPDGTYAPGTGKGLLTGCIPSLLLSIHHDIISLRISQISKSLIRQKALMVQRKGCTDQIREKLPSPI